MNISCFCIFGQLIFEKGEGVGKRRGKRVRVLCHPEKFLCLLVVFEAKNVDLSSSKSAFIAVRSLCVALLYGVIEAASQFLVPASISIQRCS